jgi:putative ATPase
VVVSVAGEAERRRLEAQLQLLDALRRPRLLTVDPDQPGQLGGQLEREERFEWIVARQPFRGLAQPTLASWLTTLTALAAPAAQGRWLFSRPRLGPAGSLAAWLAAQGQGRSRGGAERGGDGRRSLDAAIALEADWLAEQDNSAVVRQLLEQRGWRVEEGVWEEKLELRLEPDLLRRWFGPGVDYRLRLESDLGPGAAVALAALFEEQRGAALPQPMEHRLLLSRLP